MDRNCSKLRNMAYTASVKTLPDLFVFHFPPIENAPVQTTVVIDTVINRLEKTLKRTKQRCKITNLGEKSMTEQFNRGRKFMENMSTKLKGRFDR